MLIRLCSVCGEGQQSLARLSDSAGFVSHCSADSVEEGEKLIQTALDAFGRIGGIDFDVHVYWLWAMQSNHSNNFCTSFLCYGDGLFFSSTDIVINNAGWVLLSQSFPEICFTFLKRLCLASCPLCDPLQWNSRARTAVWFCLEIQYFRLVVTVASIWDWVWLDYFAIISHFPWGGINQHRWKSSTSVCYWTDLHQSDQWFHEVCRDETELGLSWIESNVLTPSPSR